MGMYQVANVDSACARCGVQVPANAVHVCRWRASRTLPPPALVPAAALAPGDAVLYEPAAGAHAYEGIRRRHDGLIPGEVLAMTPAGRVRVRLDLDYRAIGGRLQQKDVTVRATSLRPPAP